MPLTKEQKLNLLGVINGAEGIVSQIGSVRSRSGVGGDEGALVYKPGQHVLDVLDVLTRVFFRASSTPYVSLIDVQDSQHIYLSFPGRPENRNALNEGQVQNLKRLLEQVVTETSAINKMALFKGMYAARNDILLKYLLDFRHAQDVLSRNGEQSCVQEIRQIIKYKNFDQEMEAAFAQFATERFDEMLPNIAGFAPYLAKELIIMDYTTNRDDPNYGVHVEVKGAYFAKSKEEEFREFNIGLANKAHPEVGCCVGCATEFNAYGSIHTDYVFSRTADFIRNFPPKNYQLSQLTILDDEVLVSFAQEMRVRLNDVLTGGAEEIGAAQEFFAIVDSVPLEDISPLGEHVDAE